MSSARQLTHDDPAGSLGTRFEKHGYSYTCAGENVAEANILNKEFKDCGFGRVGNYWTQDFGATNEDPPVKHPKLIKVIHHEPPKHDVPIAKPKPTCTKKL
ncbi:12473_t:CDS:2 [Racocetra fulgida]|uniref:12473_t:CDS:1 n=1 Tax=Racocetra fulgida TaxID=60492 RepID=A0A9N8Z1J0_9GLOM|nr:12473_t:CDS:2 [Racocetra fulgida]